MSTPQPRYDDDDYEPPEAQQEPMLTMTMEFSIELPVDHGLHSGYVEQFLGCAWSMRVYRKFTQFTATAKSGGQMILTTTTPEETRSVRDFLRAHSTLKEF